MPARPAPPAVSVYDLDRTLTRRGTWLPFLLFAARRRASWRLLRLPEVLAAMAAHKAGLLSRGRLKALMQARLLGPRTPEPAARALAEAFAEAVVRRGLRADVLARVRADQAVGRTTAIATAALRLYAEPLARRLGVEHVIATGSVWRDGALLARLDGPNLHGSAKADALRAWLDARPEAAAGGVRLHSDDASDLPAFALASEPVAVHPGRRLRAIARARGWEVVG